MGEFEPVSENGEGYAKGELLIGVSYSSGVDNGVKIPGTEGRTDAEVKALCDAKGFPGAWVGFADRLK